jgi:Phasin protein
MYQNSRANAESPNLFSAPVLALSMWNSIMAGAPKGNAQVHEGFGMIASEWQDFVGRRLQEDISLVQRLTQSRTPDQILAAYTDFWQKAAEDYGHEITTLSKLMTGVTTKIVTAAQSDTDDATRKYVLPSRRAA